MLGMMVRVLHCFVCLLKNCILEQILFLKASKGTEDRILFTLIKRHHFIVFDPFRLKRNSLKGQTPI